MMWMRQTVFFKVVYWGAAGWQQMTSLGWCRIQTSYAVSQYCLELAGPRGYLFLHYRLKLASP